jgi:hypothetical protein
MGQRSAFLSNQVPWRKPLICLIALALTASLGAFSGVVLLRFYQSWAIQRQQTEAEILEQASYYRQAGEFDRCIETTHLLPEHPVSLQIQQTCQEQIDRKKLTDAEQLAFVHGQFANGISLAQEITSPILLEPAREFIQRATRHMMSFMEEYYQDGRIDDAIHVAMAIDVSNPLYPTVQSRIERMQAEWTTQSQLFETAQEQERTDNLDAAESFLQSITHPYWRERAQIIQDKIEARRTELNQIVAAAREDLARGDLALAVTRVSSLPSTEPWATARAEILTEAKRLEDRRFFHQILSFGVIFLLFVLAVLLK